MVFYLFMGKLNIWQKKIADRRKKSSWNDFVMEIMSWDTLVLQKNGWLISRYPETDRISWVQSMLLFDAERESFTDRWLNYDFSWSFFDNFIPLYKSIKLPSTINIGSENCDFSEISIFVKNSYLSFTVVSWCENVLYSVNIKDNSRNILNSVMVWDSSENVYMSSGILKSSNIFYSQNILNSSDVWFSTNLIWCHDCISCNWLENQSYQINNKQYAKEEYKTKKEELLKNKSWFESLHVKEKVKSWNVWSIKTTWSLNFYSENLNNWVYNYRVTDWKNVVLVWLPTWNKNIYDTYNAGSPIWSDMYWVMAAGWEHIYMCFHNNNWVNNFYSFLLDECSYCLWCVGLKNKKFCILNKQYSEEEWFELSDKIFMQMELDWILWESFPASMNPYFFNDTVASMFNAWLSKDEAAMRWFMWREKELKVDIPENSETVKATELWDYEWFDANWNWQINKEILKKVILWEDGNSYRIVPLEIEFLQKNNLPLPRTHWLERIKLWFNF
ncbi:MAG: hypothetical protein ACD_2C00091G0016 [uncultured bacterium (gcode 4)]|uniref:Uncharacterized protein n=1 Tax=uncultured bacterium (gcode 4) TaxID=1234023 RepID=K2H1V7_9BACT|nr:MAG: hypothetical protein ACD_2C00091G0016 [uncultured bacterium (gcode 4)]